MTQTKKPGNGSVLSLEQARLDAISQPTSTFFASWLKWTNRIGQDPATYDTASVLARRYELGSQIARLDRQVRFPDPSMTGTAWTTMHENLRRLEGQAKALDEILERRERATRMSGSSSNPGSKPAEPPPSSSLPTSPPSEQSSWDPFAAEA